MATEEIPCRPHERCGGLFRLDRPDSRRDVVVVYLPWLLISGSVLAAARCMPVALLSIRTCTVLNLTGYPCPFCGLTRGFVSMAEGNLAAAAVACPLAPVLYVVTVLVFAWSALALVLRVRIGPGSRCKSIGAKCIVISLGSLFLANWIYRLSAGLK